MAAGGAQTEMWSSRSGFLLASIGFAVGLGNIWRFPYVTGEYGGSAFLFVYLACVVCIGIPLLMTELAIGRRGRSSPAGSFREVAYEAGASPAWRHVGTLGVLCVFTILSYYTVLSGWTFDYLVRSVGGAFGGITSEQSGAMFGDLMNNPGRLLFWHTVVNVLIVVVVRRGVQGGIEKAVKLLMPALFAALLVMVGYGVVAGDFAAALKFMFEPDFSKITFETLMVAIGQAFFSIGIGLAAMITFGAYLPKQVSIPGSAVTVALADTGVAVIAGLVIFPLVFQFGLEPSGGPGLIFTTLPIAFGQMPGGQVFGAIFFVLLIAAALSSCIGCAEAVVSWVDEHWGVSRQKGVLMVAGGAWLLGFLSIASLGRWSGYYPLDFIPVFAGKTIFDTLDFLAANILLLIGGLLTSLFFGWVVPRSLKQDELGLGDGVLFGFWRVMLRFVIPPILLIALVLGLTQS
ncbi:MAG: sodium-dependent transporter [Pseudomonadota bacterium]